MTEAPVDLTAKGPARRRLLRGTFAAPAVFTLYSGGALAATSATCVAKAQANPQTGAVVDGPPTNTDTYLRVQLHQVTNGSNPAEYWLSGSSLGSFNGGSSIVATGKFTRFLIGSNQLSTDGGDVNKNQPQATLAYTPTKWVALRFDATGTLVGVGATGGGSAITGSCWTSTLNR